MQRRGPDVAQPYGQHAEADREEDIETAAQPIAVVEQIERLQAKGGKSGVPAEDADRDKLTKGGRNQHGPFRAGQPGKEADHKAARDIHDQRADGKSLAVLPAEKAGKPHARGSPERAAQHHG